MNTDLYLAIKALFIVIVVFEGSTALGLCIAWLTSINPWDKGNSENPPEKYEDEDYSKVYPGWSQWVYVELLNGGYTFRRDRFVRKSDGSIRHFIQYKSRPAKNECGPGTDFTEKDMRLEQFVSFEKMALEYGCEIVSE